MKEEHGGVQTDLKDVIVHFHSSPPQVLKAVIRGLSNIAHDLSSQQVNRINVNIFNSG